MAIMGGGPRAVERALERCSPGEALAWHALTAGYHPLIRALALCQPNSLLGRDAIALMFHDIISQQYGGSEAELLDRVLLEIDDTDQLLRDYEDEFMRIVWRIDDLLGQPRTRPTDDIRAVLMGHDPIVLLDDYLKEEAA